LGTTPAHKKTFFTASVTSAQFHHQELKSLFDAHHIRQTSSGCLAGYCRECVLTIQKLFGTSMEKHT